MIECIKSLTSQTSGKLMDQMTINSCDHYSCLSCDKSDTNYTKENPNYGPPLSRSQSLQCTSFPMSTNRIPLRNTKSLLETMYEVSTPNLLIETNADIFDYSLDNTLECISSIENTIDANRLSYNQSEPILIKKRPTLSRALSLQSCFPSIKTSESETKDIPIALTYKPLLNPMTSQTIIKSLLNLEESDGRTQVMSSLSLNDESLSSTQFLPQPSSSDSQIFK